MKIQVVRCSKCGAKINLSPWHPKPYDLKKLICLQCDTAPASAPEEEEKT